jgi:acyl dehydratase
MYLRHLLHQRHALAAQAGTVWSAWRAPGAPESHPDPRASRVARLALSLALARGRGRGPEDTAAGPQLSSEIALPGPELTARVAAPPRALVRDYLLHVGGDPAAYRGVLPPHLFLQWSLPLAARTLRALPYPMLRIVNAGSRIQVNASLPDDKPLTLRARLLGIEADERRAVLHQQIVTGTDGTPDALVADLYTVVPVRETGARDRARVAGGGSPRADSRVPEGAREIARWSLPRNAGLVFAALTGDFNPIHWIAPYARGFGYPGPIMHGFGTLGRAWEGLVRALFAGAADRLRAVDVRFLRPLALPANTGLYVAGTRFFVGGAPGARAAVAGSFEEISP